MFDGLFANPLHWVILIVVVLIIFGPGKLPGVGASLGKSLREFKKASQEDGPTPSYAAATVVPAGPASGASTSLLPNGNACSECGHENEPGARFCGSCGASQVKADGLVVEQSMPVAASKEPVSCPDCQTENPAASHFCAHCGKLLEHTMPRV